MREKPHYSKRTLTAAELAQRTLGKTTIAQAITKVVAGSSYPIYRQLDWQTSDYPYNAPDVYATVKVSGDKHAGPIPRFWGRAMVMAFSTEEFEELQKDHFQTPQRQAVAYVSEGITHVGTKATRGYLFERYDEDESVIAMRLGKGPLEAAAGLWLPDEKRFEPVTQVRAVESAIPIGALTTQYPGIVLV